MASQPHEAPATQPAVSAPADHSGGSMTHPVVPRVMYGTAWKKEKTADLVYLAIKSGFRAIDTAAMGRHYREDLVGEGVRRAVAEGIVKRGDLYIQTKFTPTGGPEDAAGSQVPYDPTATLEIQIQQSVASSLRNLATFPGEDGDTGFAEPYLDAVVLHSPLPTVAATRDAWRALETFVPRQVRSLGISNVSISVLEALWPTDTLASSPPPILLPTVVQNRFYRQAGFWDRAERAFCRRRGVTFQGFWILTANRELWQGSGAGFVAEVAHAAGVSRVVALYSLVLGLDVAVLDGTSDERHMVEDLEGIRKVEAWSRTEIGRNVFERSLRAFEAWISPTQPRHS